MRYFRYWLICSLFSFYVILLRVFPNIVSDHLLSMYKINMVQLSTLSSLFMWGYGIISIPAGYLIDKFGVNKCSSYSLLGVVGSFIMFALSNCIYISYIFRFSMGAFSAFAFLSVVKVICQQVPMGKKGVFLGLNIAISALGAIFCDTFLIRFSESYSLLLFIIAFLGSILSVFMFVIMRDYSDKPAIICNKLNEKMYINLKIIWKIIIIGFLAGIMYLPFALWQDLWGKGFILAVSKLNNIQSGSLIAIMYVGWVTGAVAIGKLSDFFKISYILGAMLLLETVSYLSMVNLIATSPFITMLANYFIFGFSSSSLLLLYIIGGNTIPNLQSFGVAVVNTIITLCVCIAFPLIGYTFDHASGITIFNSLAAINKSLYLDVMDIFSILLLISLAFFIFRFKHIYRNWI